MAKKWIILLILLILVVFSSPVNAHSTPFGYEFLDNGEVLNMWNSKLDYYFNTSSGLQFTNNYNVYWSKNIFCIGYKNLTTGIWDDKCNDGSILNTFSWRLYTDNLSYVSAQGYRNITFAGKTVEIGLNYSLNALQDDLTIRPSLKNVDSSNILEEIRFIWKVKDINVGSSVINNFAQANGTEVNLSRNLNTTGKVYPNEYVVLRMDTPYWFRVKWDYNQFLLQVKSESGQYNAPITLYLNDTRLNVNRTKATNLYWIDAVCSGSFVSPTPQSNQKLHDEERTQILRGCINLFSCPASVECEEYIRIQRRTEGASGFSLIAQGIQPVPDCSLNAYLQAPYTFLHNNKTDLRVGYFRDLPSGFGCIPSATPVGPEVRDDIWLNNHTPSSYNVSIQLFNDTYINLDGNDDYVNASRFNNFKLRDFLNNYTLTGWSVVGWAKIQGNNAPQVVLAQGDNGGTGRNWIVFKPASCNTKIGTNLAGTNVCTNVTPNSNSWYQIALTYNTTTTKIYVNGSFMNATNQNPDENAQGDVLFGVAKNIGSDLNGSLDNFMFYNRTLSDSEINVLFANGSGRITNPSINQTDLQVWYSMDEGFGINTTDRINLYQANLTNQANWTNLGTAGAYCPYAYQDLDGDSQNLTMPPPYISWFLDGDILNSMFDNQLFVYTNDPNYDCCVKVNDNVFVTGAEQFSCNTQLNQQFLVSIFIGIIAFAGILIYLAIKISKKHTIITYLFILIAGFVLWVLINMFRFYIDDAFINGISGAYLTALLLFGFMILIKVLIEIIKKIKNK